MSWTDPPTFTGVYQQSANWNTYLRDNLLAQGEALRHIWIDPTLYDDGKTGAWSVVTDVTPPNDPYGYGLSHGTLNDYITFKEYLTPGQWSLNIYTALRNDYGTLYVIILDPDGNPLELEKTTERLTVPGEVGKFNCYTDQAQAQFTIADPVEFSIPEAGLYTIKLQVLQKDINSAGNTVRLFGVGLQKLSDLESSPVVWTPPRTWTGEAVSAAKLEAHLRNNLRMSGPFPRRHYIDAFEWAATSGGTLVVNSTTALGFFTQLDTQNEWVEWPLVLPAGDITIRIIGTANTDAGIATVRWDGSDRGTIDFYAAALDTNARPAGITFTNATPKKATLRITNATKNASSSAYNVKIHRIVVTWDNTTWADPPHIAARDLTEVADLNNGWRTPMRMRGEMPWIIDIDPVTCPAVDSNEWSTFSKNDALPYFSSLGTNSGKLPGYDGFWIEYDVPLAAGTYTCAVVAARGTDAGQVDVLLDGTAVATGLEFYNAGPSYAIRTQTGIVVATTKTYRVRVRVLTKNASALHYYCSLIRLRFRRTA